LAAETFGGDVLSARGSWPKEAAATMEKRKTAKTSDTHNDFFMVGTRRNILRKTFGP
jgi:hypothetical protein